MKEAVSIKAAGYEGRCQHKGCGSKQSNIKCMDPFDTVFKNRESENISSLFFLTFCGGSSSLLYKKTMSEKQKLLVSYFKF